MAQCISCEYWFDGPWNDDGNCPGCALENEGDYSLAVADVLESNAAEAIRREAYHDSLPEGQRSGKRHTGG